MMERFSCWLLLLTTVSLLMPKAAWSADDCSHLIATGNAEYPPYLWRDPSNTQRLIGANADLIKYLGSRLGLDIEMVYAGPWSRAQEEVRAGRIDMLAGYFFTKERQQVVDFIYPPFLFTPSMVWVRPQDAFVYHKWSDLIGRNGGTLVNNSNGQAFDDYAKANLSLEAVPTASQAFQKLIHKRNDYVIFEQFPGKALALKLGVEGAVIALEPPVSSEGLYLALSQNSNCNQPSLRQRLTAEMENIASGALPQTFVERNLELWNKQQQSGLNP
ncbi:substrate-binding periplasmic protein [Pseudomonas sp. NPDC090202]|uniref:substrate-binding periplasmic protein n=1 Tax=unclassified Pseudomonas TaxID=196821 RepID=UPI003826E49C